MTRNKTIFPVLFLLITIIGALFFIKNKTMLIPSNEMLKLTSPSFTSDIPPKYTCDGDDINPPLFIESVPAGAQSLVLIVDDPDAPAGTWVHWLVWNIDPLTSTIEENSVPSDSVQGTTSFGKPGYGGPCPPSGRHRYFFKLYALDTMIELSESAKKEELEKAMQGHILDQAELVGSYGR